MALATKHRFTFKNIQGSTVQVDLMLEGYGGSVITHNQVATNPVILNWDSDGDGYDKFTPILKGTAITRWVVASSGESLRELITATDLQYFMNITIASAVVFYGPVVIGKYSEPYTQVYPFEIEIMAGCGLSYLQEIPFKNSSDLAYTYAGNMSLMEIIVACLGKSNPLSIYLYNNLIENSQTDSTTTSLLTQTYLNPQVFYSEDTDDAMTCYEVLTEIMKSIGSRLFQSGGVWRIYRISEISSASFAYIIYTSAGAYSSHGSTNLGTNITNTAASLSTRYVPVGDDAMLDTLMPYKKVTVQQSLNPVGNMVIAGNFNEWVGNDPQGWVDNVYTECDSPVDEGSIGKVIRVPYQPDDTAYYYQAQIRYDVYTGNDLKIKITIRYRNYNVSAGTWYFRVQLKAIGVVDWYLRVATGVGYWENTAQYIIVPIDLDGEWHEYEVLAATPPAGTGITECQVKLMPGTLDGSGSNKIDIDYIKVEPYGSDTVQRAYADGYKNFTKVNNNAFKYEPDVINVMLGDRIISPTRQEVDRGWFMLSSGSPTDAWGKKSGTKNRAISQVLADDIAAQYPRALFLLSGRFEGAFNMARYTIDPFDGNRTYLPMRMEWDVLNREANIEFIELI